MDSGIKNEGKDKDAICSISIGIINAKNNPVFKLDKLAPMNGIEHSDAHSAIADVLATVEIAKLLSKTAPNVWKASLLTTNKDKTLQLIKNELTFCTDFFYYGKCFPFVFRQRLWRKIERTSRLLGA